MLEQLYYIIEKRPSQGLYTIFTSNLTTKDVEQSWRPTGLAEGAFHAGVRVIERIREYGDTTLFTKALLFPAEVDNPVHMEYSTVSRDDETEEVFAALTLGRALR